MIFVYGDTFTGSCQHTPIADIHSNTYTANSGKVDFDVKSEISVLYEIRNSISIVAYLLVSSLFGTRICPTQEKY